MPPPPVSAAIDAFLREPNPAVIGTLRPDGSPHTVATWYDWDGELVLLNMDASRRRLEFMRRDPRVSLTVLDRESWYRHVSLRGRVVRIEDDPELAEIDRLAQRYYGRPHGTRDRPRVSAWARVEAWYAWPVGSFDG
jgi:PPOX class probable F420-dependent enzyme